MMDGIHLMDGSGIHLLRYFGFCGGIFSDVCTEAIA